MIFLKARCSVMYITTAGLVLRETLYKESSKILNVLTPEHGRITVLAKGARRRGAKTAASTQLLAFSEMTLFEGKSGYTLTEARCLEMFEELRSDLSLLSLGSYFAEVLEALSDEDSHDGALLSLGLNAFYALSHGMYTQNIIKAAFELRAVCLAGYEPRTDACSVCGAETPEKPALDVSGGSVHCAGCEVFGAEDAFLCPASLAAVRHIVNAEPKRVFSFTLGADAERRLSRACEKYLTAQLDRSFKTLDFYKSIL